ncbi:MAG: HPr family phosphocarrier protein [bacterium]|nr:HPr family phosphocarrier protein [bacterium]MDT8394903.1 HPr family phosphocarrier protein [bacterium]
MVRVDVIISNELGLHARAAARFVEAAARFTCEVWLSKDGHKVNGKSIMGILTLAAARGEKVTIEVEGVNETMALAELKVLIEGGFGEKR